MVDDFFDFALNKFRWFTKVDVWQVLIFDITILVVRDGSPRDRCSGVLTGQP